MNWYKRAMAGFRQTLTQDQMIDFIEKNSLRDWSGKLDYDDAKEMSRAATSWTLTEIPLDKFDWYANPKYKNKSINIPPIVVDLGDNEYEVLDGKHRIGMAIARGDKTIQVYLGKI